MDFRETLLRFLHQSDNGQFIDFTSLVIPFESERSRIASILRGMEEDNLVKIAQGYTMLSAKSEGAYFRLTDCNLKARLTPTGLAFLKENYSEKKNTDSQRPESNGMFSKAERISVSEKLDDLVKKLERLETGQRLIYDDVIEEIEELKKLLEVLNKKTWGQTLKGKLIDWGLGQLTDKGFSLLTEAFKDDRLLGR